MKVSKKLPTKTGTNVTTVANIVTIHSDFFRLIFGNILLTADPAACRFTALAVILVSTMTIIAIDPSPSRLAMVLGSELFASYTPEVMAILIVATNPINANQKTPKSAPMNGAVTAICFLFVKRVKSAPAVTQAKLNAAVYQLQLQKAFYAY